MTPQDADQQELQKAFDAAVELHRSGNMDAAIPVYNKVHEIWPDHSGALHMLGVVALQSGELKEAEHKVRKALRYDNLEAKYNNTLGSILLELGQFLGATKAFDAALSRDPKFAMAAYNNGTVLLTLGRFAEAETAFQVALEIGANDANLYNNLANTLIRQGRILEAVEQCRAGLEIHNNNPELGTSLASALELSNNLEEAEKEIGSVRKAYPNFTMACLIHARVLRRRGLLEEARENLGPVLSASLTASDEAEANYEMGLIQDSRKNFSEAFQNFSRCNFLLSQNPEAVRCDGDRYLDEIRAYRNWDDQTVPQKLPSSKVSMAPVFFIGFPRSGTDSHGAVA